ncbi:MAG: hypothetical protein IJ584_02885 [Bacteroidales bacterium]|nr:hypothetical protein [Bacteroidales bacterium]
MWKRLAQIGLIALVILAPALSFPFLASALAFDAYERMRARRAAEGRKSGLDRRLDERRERRERRQERRRSEARSVQARREQAVEYDRRNGWNIGRLPFDMTADLTTAREGRMQFTAAGIPGLVTGLAKGRDVEYSFLVDDPEKAEALRKKSRMYNGAADVVRQEDGRFRVVAYNAAAINDLAKEAFPAVKHQVEREIVLTRQYSLQGYDSYEEALKAFKADRERFSPVNSFTKVTDSVDGVKEERSNGERLDPKVMAHREWLITEEEVTRYAGQVVVPGSIVSDEDIVVYARNHFEPGDSNKVILSKEDALRLSDGTPEAAARYIVDEAGNALRLYDPSAKEVKELHPYLICADMDSLAEYLNGDEIPKGSFLVLDDRRPDVTDGRFYIELDADDDIRSLLGIQGEASPSFAAKCESLGIGSEQLEASLLMREAAEKGYADVALRDSVSLSRVRVNGVPVEELADRLSDERLERLDRKAAEVWLRDAAKIQAVNITIDAKRAEMRITSCVDNVQKVETRKLTDREIQSFSRRGKISKSEMKDLLMQVHPDYFKSYSIGGKGVYEDPVRDFLEGKKPVVSTTLKAQMEKAKGLDPALKNPVPKPKPAKRQKPSGPKLH